jgi:hypothetical protein
MKVLVTGHRGYIGPSGWVLQEAGHDVAGMEELLARDRAHGFSTRDFDGEQFVRLRTLGHRPDRGDG